MTEYYISVKCPTCNIQMLMKKYSTRWSHICIIGYYSFPFECPKCGLKITINLEGDGDVDWDEVIEINDL